MRDDLATSKEECRARCCVDAACITFQFDDVAREGSQCCGAVCWRGRAIMRNGTCKGPIISDQSTSGDKLYMPVLGEAAPANATVTEMILTPGDAVALALSGGVMLLLTAICFWCSRRRLSTRAVFPRDQPKRVENETLQLGDMIMASTGEIIDPINALWTPVHPPARTGANQTEANRAGPDDLEVVDLDYIDCPTKRLPPLSGVAMLRYGGSSSPADSSSLVDVSIRDEELMMLPDSPSLAVAGEPSVVVALRDVNLADDAYGGVWAMVRDTTNEYRDILQLERAFEEDTTEQCSPPQGRRMKKSSAGLHMSFDNDDAVVNDLVLRSSYGCQSVGT